MKVLIHLIMLMLFKFYFERKKGRNSIGNLKVNCIMKILINFNILIYIHI